MTSLRERAILNELAKRKRLPRAVASIEASLFDRQRELYECTSKRIVTDTGRRGGKTFAVSALAVRLAMDHPGETIPIIERTQTCQAAEVFWKTLVELNDMFKLNIRFHHTLKRATLPNQSVICLMSADTVEAADKIRGGRYPGAIIDEAGTYRNRILEYLIYEALQPALLDHNGVLVLAGTPNATCDGPFYKAVHSDQWAHFRWTMLDNPRLPLDQSGMSEAQAYQWRVDWLANHKLQNGWSDDNPRLLREWYGLWVTNNEELVYSGYQKTNNCAAPDTNAGRWYYVLGIDLGFNEPSAFVVLAFNDEEPHIYVLESYEEAGLIPSAVAAHVERLRNRYNFMSIVADTGGYGKGVVEEMRQRFNIPIEAAKKKDKMGHIAIMNGDFLNGTIKVVASRNRDLISDWLRLPKNDEGTGEHPGFANHLPDAALYGYRKCLSLVKGLGERDSTYKRGSAEHAAAQEAEMLQAAIDSAVRNGGRGGDALSEALGMLDY